MLCVYTTLACSLDLLVGHTGLLSLCHSAFFGLGAYVSSLVAVHYNVPFLPGMLAAAAVTSLFSLLASIPSLRLRGDYFIIATFSLQMLLYSAFRNLASVTRGPRGISGIPLPKLLGTTVQSQLALALLAAILACLSYIFIVRVTNSSFGRVLRAIREDERFAQAFGRNTVAFKITAFSVGAAFAGIAGSFFAHYITYIDPSSFGATESIMLLSMVIIGGPGSRWGPLVGSATLVLVPEALRFVGFPDAIAANLRQIFYGSSLTVLMLFRPSGLVGKYDFQKN